MSGPNSKRTDVSTDYAPLPGDYNAYLMALEPSQKGSGRLVEGGPSFPKIQLGYKGGW
jgi:hypothetical protein